MSASDAANREQAATWARETLRALLDNSKDGKAIAFTLQAPREITVPASARFRAWTATCEGIEVELLHDGTTATIEFANFTSDAGGSVERRTIAPEIATTFLLRGAALASAKAQARKPGDRNFHSNSSHAYTAAFAVEWIPPGEKSPSVVTLGPERARRYPTHPEDVVCPSLELLHREIMRLFESATVASADENAKAADAARARARRVLDDPAMRLDSVRFHAQLLSDIGTAEDDDRLSKLAGRLSDDVVEGLRVSLELRGLATAERPERVRQLLSKNGYWARVRTRAFLRRQTDSDVAQWLAPLLDAGTFEALAEEPRKDVLAAFLEALPGTDPLAQPLPPELRTNNETLQNTARGVADRWHEPDRVRLRAKSLLP